MGMMNQNRPNVVSRGELTAAEHQAVEALRAICNQADGLKLKLNVDGPPDSPDAPDRFLVWDGDRLAGFCSLDGHHEVEICGMVHPADRLQGRGHALFAAAVAECRRRAAETVLLICEFGSPAGQRFGAAVGGRYAFAEHHMELDAAAPLAAAATRAGDPRLTLKRAVPEDASAIAAITARAFDSSLEEARERIAADLAAPAQQWWYLASLGDLPIGSLKVYPWAADGAGIYAFGVLPEYRGRGLGRQILTETIALLRATQRTRLSLEVETENAPALGLYRSCGFTMTTTYGYYAVPLDT
jgi:ribosomal protein S18 acetylase RimI-like enzyme